MKFKIEFNELPTASLQQARAGYNPQTNRIMMYEPPNVRRAKIIYQNALRPYKPKEPIMGPKHLILTFSFGIKDKKKQGMWKMTKTDIDNLCKIVTDRLTRLQFFYDDSEIVWLEGRKRYCEADEKPSLTVEIEEMHPSYKHCFNE